jgi:hypothetical protein
VLVIIVSCDVSKVNVPVSFITLSDSQLELEVGETYELECVVSPYNANNKRVIWTSSNRAVASVNDGIVVAVKVGKAIIAARSDDGGMTAECEVIVKENLSSGDNDGSGSDDGSDDELDVTAAIDLSLKGSANCYVVSKTGIYKFKAVRGNGNQSVGDVVSCSVLWETFGTAVKPSVNDLISAVDFKNGYVVFSTPASFKEGNAVIAARDAQGDILWSWHIWLVEDEIKSCTYVNDAGVLMDRNLGATSALPGSSSSFGLLYQWGRKDPFLGASEPDLIDDISEPAASTIEWPGYVVSNSVRGTIEYATKHPTTYIVYGEVSDWDWLHIDGDSEPIRWQSDKTIYDPCPPGWKVADFNVWEKAGLSFDYEVEHDLYVEEDMGILLSNEYCTPSAWYPAAGYVYWDEDSMPIIEGCGNTGAYWSSTKDNLDNAYGMFFWSGMMMDGSWDNYSACSIRCQKI